MDTLVRRRRFVWYATASVVVAGALEIALAYALWPFPGNDDRPVWLNLINVHGGIMGLLLLGGAATHAWRTKRHKWAIFMLFVWPVAFLYAFLLDTSWVNE